MREVNPRSPLALLLIGAVLLYAGVLLIAPIVAIIQGAFARGIEPVIQALTTEDALIALRLTFTLAGAAALINTIFGIAIAWVLVRHDFVGKRFFDALVDLPFVVSPVIVGYVMIVLFGRGGWFSGLPFQIAFSWPGMLLVTIFVSLPFVIREVMPVLSSLTPEQEEAAYTLGASKWLTFRRIVLPGIWRGILYGIVLTLARSIGEFGAVTVAGGGIEGVTETATIYVFRLLQGRGAVGAYSMALALGGLSVIILLLMKVLRSSTITKEVADVDIIG